MPVVIAKRRSACAYCRLSIQVGERIDYTRATGARHLACADDRDDPETQIVTAYLSLRMPPHDYDDARAVDECEREYGRGNARRALYTVSPIAKQREDEYRSKRKVRTA